LVAYTLQLAFEYCPYIFGRALGYSPIDIYMSRYSNGGDTDYFTSILNRSDASDVELLGAFRCTRKGRAICLDDKSLGAQSSVSY